MDQIQQRERAFGGCGYDDEIERSVVAIGDERGRVVGLGLGGGGREEGWEREEVAAAAGAGGDEGEDFGD